MKNFNDITYETISYQKTKQEISRLLDTLNQADDFDTFLSICEKIISIQNHIEEMCDYADIRNMRDCNDTFFQEQMLFWNTYKPKFDLLFIPFYQKILDSDYYTKLLEKMPKNFFDTITYQLKISSEETIELQQQEKELMKKYRDLSKNKIMYDGEDRSIPYISGYFTHPDRLMRKKAHDTINDYYYTKQKEYDSLLYDLVSVRNAIANKLGFDHYGTYSLYKMRRFGYNYTHIHQFRDHIIQYIIPLCEKISGWQKTTLCLEKLEYFDDKILFSEMPESKYCGNELIQELENSFAKIDSSLSSLFHDMVCYDYIDLLQRDNKINFAITNYLTETGYPVITGNFKNNYLDIQTTAHEMGHAFQKYCASIQDKNHIVSALLKYPTMEIAEIFSHAMELISIPYFDNLFQEKDYYKYCFMKIYHMIQNLPYICLVDEFQEKIYSNHHLKVEDIRITWMELVKKYHLETSNTGHINLDSGGFFYRQSHIYLKPFYYIDYALSSFGAFAIWDGCQNDMHLFQTVGSVASYYSLHELIQQYNMPNPFDEKTIQTTSEKLEKTLLYFKKKIM